MYLALGPTTLNPALKQADKGRNEGINEWTRK